MTLPGSVVTGDAAQRRVRFAVDDPPSRDQVLTGGAVIVAQRPGHATQLRIGLLTHG